MKVVSHRAHRMVDRMILGREYPEVHRVKDLAFTTLGKYHRSIHHIRFGADPPEKLAHNLLDNIILFGNNPGKLVSALLHDAVDSATSKNPLLKILLEAIS